MIKLFNYVIFAGMSIIAKWTQLLTTFFHFKLFSILAITYMEIYFMKHNT